MTISKRDLCLIAVLAAAGCETVADAPTPVDSPPTAPHSVPIGPPVIVPPNVGGSGPVLPTPAGSLAAFCASSGAAGAFGGPMVMSEPIARATTTAEKAPPPISGGTFITTHDGSMVIASDPDRDRLYFVDAKQETLLFVRELSPGDEPGRLIEDAQGRVHVALRGAGAIATLTRQEADPIVRRPVCDLPRGLAYAADQDAVHVACAEGKLVTLGAAPSGSITRRLELGDVRDVVVRGSQLYVSRFRSAEVLNIAADGSVAARTAPATLTHPEVVFSMGQNGPCGKEEKLEVESSANVAWRMIDVPRHGLGLLHQRSREAEVQVTAGGYGGGFGCSPGITHSALTLGVEANVQYTADLGNLTLAVDIATDPDGALIAAVAPGNSGMQMPQVEVYRTNDTLLWNSASPNAGGRSEVLDQGVCANASVFTQATPGQATALTFSTPYVLAVQSREPAGISFVDVRTGELRSHLDLKQESRFDTGHALFHARTGAGLACASCHAEAGDDNHLWTFHGIGARRTQQLRGGILGTEPFHWNGDMSDFPMLVKEVFMGRMQGVELTADKTQALATWIDRQPGYKLTASDALAAERGQALFNSAAVGCNDCHAGTHLTNNKTVDVGTGAALQVPSLRNVALRSPIMHDGCAKTLRERFTLAACGGGDKHGHTSQLTPAQLDDLVVYVNTL